MIPLVIIESPLAGDLPRNLAYARAAMLDSFARGEAPIAFHLLYPQIFNDLDEEERIAALFRSFEWQRAATRIAFYMDLGLSPGMRLAKKMIEESWPHRPVLTYRSIS